MNEVLFTVFVNFSDTFSLKKKKIMSKISNSAIHFKLELGLKPTIDLPDFLKYYRHLKCQIHRLF